jgi:hypothetical protein
MATAKWCCSAFENAYLLEDERGVAAMYEHMGDMVRFSLLFRAVEKQYQTQLVQSFPLTVVQQVPIKCCPWCGTNLAKHYGRQIQLLPKLRDPVGGL